LALAVHALEFAYAPEYQEEVEYPYMSLAWYEQELQKWENSFDVEEDWVIS
jgi:hypothetical protein